MNIFLFHGEDSYSSSQQIKDWSNKFLQKYGEDGIEIIDGKKLNLQNLLTDLNSIPFLSEKRLFIVRDFLANAKEETKKLLTEKLETITDANILIFHETKAADKRTALYKKLKKIAQEKEFKQLTPEETQSTLIKEHKISPQIARKLTEYCGNNLHKLTNEIQKLQTFRQTEPIEIKDIEQLCTPSIETSIFNLTDNLGRKNSATSIKILQQLDQSGQDHVQIFFMLVRHFRILIQIKALSEDGMSEQQSQKILNLHPFIIKKSREQNRFWPTETLHKIYKQFLQIERDFKTGKTKLTEKNHKPYLLAIEKLIINFTK